VERFDRTVLDEFFREVCRERFYDSVEALQTDLDHWLVYYNTERPRATAIRADGPWKRFSSASMVFRKQRESTFHACAVLRL
jgi:hypothetical protein